MNNIHMKIYEGKFQSVMKCLFRYDNMTNKYYALRVMSHVHQGACRREWEEFVARSSADQSLEVGAILMARWFQPHADISIKQVPIKSILINMCLFIFFTIYLLNCLWIRS